jgi:predicted TIM-barrel fold metal-dependent hydrolase
MAIVMIAFVLLPAAIMAQRGGNTVQIEPGAACPAGMTEVRPGQCRAPEFDLPSIVDYRPESTLVTGEHLVPSARFPVVDVHGHAQGLAQPGTIEGMIPELDALNLRVYVAADNMTGDRLVETLAAIASSPYPDRFRVLAGINFRDMSPGWGERAAEEVEAAIRGGAIGVGEVSKSFGLTLTKPDGSRLQVDDPDLDPVWETLARLGVPAFIHTAEPPEFFQPLDYTNERWLELALFPDRRNYGPDHVTFEQLVIERDNLFRRHPDTQFIAAHFGWHANDLGRAARMLDEFPNVSVEVGAILYELGRQPRAVHDFFVRYQDRILFGKDSYQPSEFPYYWRVFETNDEYFDYYRDYHAFWKLYGAGLPDDILKKLYYQNALGLFPGLPETGWPE